MEATTILSRSVCHCGEAVTLKSRAARGKVANRTVNAIPLGLALILLLIGLFQGARRGFMDVELVTKRVRAEFEEMPGMTLTMRQASRLFGIERETCKAVVDRLIRTHYLKWTISGSFTRAGQ
jgi:hypothetical protein